MMIRYSGLLFWATL